MESTPAPKLALGHNDQLKYNRLAMELVSFVRKQDSQLLQFSEEMDGFISSHVEKRAVAIRADFDADLKRETDLRQRYFADWSAAVSLLDEVLKSCSDGQALPSSLIEKIQSRGA